MAIESFYRQKTVLVTGHTGFKGGWLCLWLKALGARVIGLALPPSPATPSLYAAANVAGGMQSVLGDIRDAALVRRTFDEHRPEIVFHLAAQPLVRRSYAEPIETFHTNVLGTVHVLEAVRRCPSVRSVVVVTTDKCYENHEWPWAYRENDGLGGHDPYSSSKACAEIATAAYRRSFFAAADAAEVATARAGNVIGGGDWSTDRLVPDVLRSLAAGQPVVLRSPDAVRPWQHVLEPLRGYLLLAERLWTRPGKFAEAWNFGPTDEACVPVRDLATRLGRLWGPSRIVCQPSADAPHEARQLTLDSSKARQRLDWRPFLTLDDALYMTVDWQRHYLKSPDSLAACTAGQIESYMQGLRPCQKTAA
jgi:CDP-glucose 4,6-dehydratase